jgi:hypothetical protein
LNPEDGPSFVIISEIPVKKKNAEETKSIGVQCGATILNIVKLKVPEIMSSILILIEMRTKE